MVWLILILFLLVADIVIYIVYRHLKKKKEIEKQKSEELKDDK